MTKGTEPAFPALEAIRKDHGYKYSQKGGISVRLYLAGIILQGIISNNLPDDFILDHEGTRTDDCQTKVKLSLLFADELIKQEEESR